MSATTTNNLRLLDFRSRHFRSRRMRNSCKGRIAALALALASVSSLVADEHDRSPVDLVLGPGDAWLVAVNQTSDSVSLLRTSDGEILDEQPVGHHPAGIALSPDGKTI